MKIFAAWQTWALLSATFAALTAICAKIGIQNVNSDFATFVRTLVILLIAGGIVLATGHWQDPTKIPARTWVFLILSGCATGLSWLCYFRALQLGQASQVAPIDKLSVVMVALIAVAFLGESLSLAAWAGVALIAGGAILVAVG